MFIVFEGLDGAGKTTQITKLAEWFFLQKCPVWVTEEPSPNDVGKLIREYFVNPPDLELLSVTGQREGNNCYDLRNLFYNYLLAADRLLHTHGKGGIAQHLYAQKIVISSRYLLSNFAYNCSNDYDLELVKDLNHPDIAITPDITIYLDITPENAIARMQGKVRDSMEQLEKLYRVREIYDRFLNLDFDNLYTGFSITIDVNNSDPDEVHKKITEIIESTFVGEYKIPPKINAVPLKRVDLKTDFF